MIYNLIIPILIFTLQKGSFPQVELVDFFADYFKDHVCIGEVVAVPVPGISQPEYAEILSATRIKPASNPNTAAPDSSATTETTSISSANAQSTTTAPPLPPIVTATSTGNPTSSAQVSPSKKSSSSSAHAMLVTKPLTNSFRISEHEIHVVMLNPGGFE